MNSFDAPRRSITSRFGVARSVAVLLVSGTAMIAGCGSDDLVVSVDPSDSPVSTDDAAAATTTTDPSLPSDDGGVGASGSTLNPVAGEWQLRFAVLEGDMAIVIPHTAIPTMTINGTDIDVFYGCNSGSGTVAYDISGDAFSVEGLSSTEMGCSGEIAAIEEAVTLVLSRATRFDSAPGSLSIGDGAEFPSTLEFEPAV